MTNVLHDLRVAIRSLIRNPRFAIAAVITAAIGVGMTTAMFSIVDGVVLSRLPYNDASRLVYVGITGSDQRPFFATSTPDFMDWREHLSSLDHLGALQPTSVVLMRDDTAVRLASARVSRDVMPLFGLVPALGRAFSTEEYESGANNVALLSHDLWLRWGADPKIVGTEIPTIDVLGSDSSSLLVVGVLPRGFRAPSAARMEGPQLWLPLPMDAAAYATSRTSRSLRVIGRLAPETSVAESREEAQTLALALAAEHPAAYMVSEAGQLSIGVASLRDQTIGDTGHLVVMLFGGTGFLLLIGCANIANLLLARTGGRGQEMALRFALGASRRRIFSQLLTESAFLGVVGGVAGIVIAALLVRVVQTIGPSDIPRLTEVTINLHGCVFALAASLTTGLLFGLAPGFLALRSRQVGNLRQGNRIQSSGMGAARTRRALIVTEVALALILVSGAGLLAGSYIRLHRVDPGFDSAGVLTTPVGMPESVIPREQRSSYLGELMREVSALPGVDSVSCVSTLPVNGFTAWSPGVLAEGSEEPTISGFDGLFAGPDYFTTMGIDILAGRGLTPRDTANEIGVAVISQTTARRLWGEENPIGKRLKFSGESSPWLTVVGLVADVHTVGLATDPAGEIYLSMAQAPPISWLQWTHLVIRAKGTPPQLSHQIQAALHRVDPRVPFDGVHVLGGKVSSSVNGPRFNAFVWLLFGATALALAAVGISAMLLHAVCQRTREIGIRVALGASPANVLRMVVGEGLRLTALGTVIGLLGTLALSRLLAKLLYGVSPTDPLTLAGACLTLLAVSTLACTVPARRATETDPAVALRAE